jgi:hypothetical protein
MMARTGAGDEKVKLEKALTAHNNAHISTIHGAPNEVGKSQDIQFLNLVDNAANFKHNTKVLGERTIALEKTGAFRKPLGGVTKNAFRRGFDAKWGEVENVARIEGSQVVGEKGTRVDIKLVKAVPASSSQPETIERETARTEKKREALFDLMDILVDWLGGQEKSLRAAALHLARTRFDLGNRQVLYKDLLRSQGFTGFGALADAVRLFPRTFKLTRGAFYFRAVN